MKSAATAMPIIGVTADLTPVPCCIHKRYSHAMTPSTGVAIALASLFLQFAAVSAGELSVTIEPASRVASIGVVCRFAADGTLVRPVDPKAQFEAPYRDGISTSVPATFSSLKNGTYDLIIFLKDGTRLEGFHIPPFDELDEVGDVKFSDPPPQEVQDQIVKLIKNSKYYENKVTPLFLRGQDEHVRVLMQLLRDEATSFDAEYGAPVATVRYELWQFTNRFGTWSRDRKSKVLHRVLESKDKLTKRRWLWASELGGFTITDETPQQKVIYQVPEHQEDLPGLNAK